MTQLGIREDEFRDRVAGRIRELKGTFKFGGAQITKVSTAVPTGGKEADIVCYNNTVPYILIETKIKSGKRYSYAYSPLDSSVVGQAFAYAYLMSREISAPKVVATMNEKDFALFETPRDLKEFVNPKYVNSGEWDRVLKPGALTKLMKDRLLLTGKFRMDDIPSILDRSVKLLTDKTLLKPNFSDAIISRMNQFVEFITDYVDQKVDTDDFKNHLSESEKIKIKDYARGDFLNYSRMLSYILMDKILTYRLLEDHYTQLPRLEPFKTYVNMRSKLMDYFDIARKVTNDFVPIFKTDIFDNISFPEVKTVMEYFNEFIRTLNSIDVRNFVSYVGYTHESIIPPLDRHKLGEFYTPPPIAEFITSWAIQNDGDKILDPGTGSGTFLAKAYRRLAELKLGNDKEIPPEIHADILSQLFGLDINPFSVHLSTLNLSLRDLKNSSDRISIRQTDYFKLSESQIDWPGDEYQTTDLTSINYFERSYDAIVGNPPYTRWTEIDDQTKSLIRRRVGAIARYYRIPMNSMPGRQGQIPGIYVFWLIHSQGFLKTGGRIGFIISDLWLQAAYGKRFQAYLLDNFKVYALIDFKSKVFEAPLISTIITLLVKCTDKRERDENTVKFMTIEGTLNSSELTKVIGGANPGDGVRIRSVKQDDLRENDSWFVYFGNWKYPNYWKNNHFVPLSTFFTVSKGNTQWHIEEQQGAGASTFFFMNKETIDKFSIPQRYLLPALKAARDTQHFIIDQNEIHNNIGSGKSSYFFECSESRDVVDSNALSYIIWGETECKTSEGEKGKVCGQTSTCQTRGLNAKYGNWYNLGYHRNPVFLATYHGWNRTRFVLNEVSDIVVTHNFVSFCWEDDSKKLSKTEVNALLAYLNSSYAQLYIELKGGKSGGGVIDLEIDVAKQLPVLDVRRLSMETRNELANAFIELHKRSIEIGGAASESRLEKLADNFEKIDLIIERILQAEGVDVNSLEVQSMFNGLFNKRKEDSRGVSQHVTGTEDDDVLMARHQKRRRSERIHLGPSLDEFKE